ncbi:MAG TPA: HNH endonuclease [Acidimicrobiales bacterium]|nr:HNH endonuclease [Acidimicrobiales bacterium]
MRPLRHRWLALRATLRAWWRARRVAARNRASARTCFYCDVPFSGHRHGPDHRTVDHRIPRSRGGSEGLSNLVFACYACNQRKRDRPEDEFVASDWLAQRRAEVAGRSRHPG